MSRLYSERLAQTASHTLVCRLKPTSSKPCRRVMSNQKHTMLHLTFCALLLFLLAHRVFIYVFLAITHSIPTRFIKTKALSVARFGFFQFPRRQRYFSKVLSVPAELCGCVSGWFHILPFPDMLLLFRFYVHLCYVPCCVAPCSLYAYLFICLFSPRYRVCALVRFLGPTILRPQSYHHSFSSVWNELIYFIYFPHFYHNASLQASSPHTHTPSADGYLEIQPAQSEQCRPATKQILYVAVCYRIHVAYFSKEASTRTRKQRKQTPATVW